ncbi:MAG: response regulator [Methylococcales bacterium]|nr:response regulator [Methylococcales bacterium]
MIFCCEEDGTATAPMNAFSVVDWIHKPISQRQLQQALHAAIHNNRRSKVLHIEDDLDVIQVVQTILKNAAVDYRFATTIADARLFLQSQAFDLVILDLTLPDGSEIDLLNELKDLCPVMVFSGDDVHDSLSQQVAAALTKSMTNNDQLLSTIRRVLNNTVKSAY